MSIFYQILGKPFRDNALLVRIDTGNSHFRFLFDCGEAVLSGVGLSEIQANDEVFFSHFHTDHIAGFDSFIRANYDRTTKKVRVWGPKDTLRVLSHRLQGFTWNLVQNSTAIWEIKEIQEKSLHSATFYTSEGFFNMHDCYTEPWEEVILSSPWFKIKAIPLHHGIPSMGYLVEEKTRWNIDKEKISLLGLPPGPWLKEVKEYSESSQEKYISIQGKEYSLKELNESLLISTPGESIAYLTDFIMDANTQEKLLKFLPKGCTLVCESQYLREDRELAQKNYHLTSEDAAWIAKNAEAKKLILVHFSQRYEISQVKKLLEDARNIFPETFLPDEWNQYFVY